jgi:hypothetical protein
MGGYQFIKSKVISNPAENITHTKDQSQWAAGFEFVIAEGGVLNATVGQVDVKHHSNHGATKADLAKGNSSALRFDLNLSVKF